MKLMRKMEELPISDILFLKTQKQLKIIYHAHSPEKIICVNKELILIRPRGTKIKTNNKKHLIRTCPFSSLLIFSTGGLLVSKVSKFLSRKKWNKESKITSQIKLSLFLQGRFSMNHSDSLKNVFYKIIQNLI